EDGDVGRELLHERHGFVAAPGLPHDFVALFFEGLLQIEANDRLVLGDDDADGQRGLPLDRGFAQRDGSARRRSSSWSCIRSSSASWFRTSARWRAMASA